MKKFTRLKKLTRDLLAKNIKSNMLKIKLLILLLINLTILVVQKTKEAVNTFNVGYIESDIDGLIAYNFLKVT